MSLTEIKLDTLNPPPVFVRLARVPEDELSTVMMFPELPFTFHAPTVVVPLAGSLRK